MRRRPVSFAKTHAAFGINHLAAVAFCYNCPPCFDMSNAASQRWFAFFARDRVSSLRIWHCVFSAVSSAEGAHSASKPRELRPTFLDSRSACMVRLEAVAPLGQSGNSCPLAQSRVSPVLEVGFQSQWTDGKKTGLPGSWRSHLPDGR